MHEFFMHQCHQHVIILMISSMQHLCDTPCLMFLASKTFTTNYSGENWNSTVAVYFCLLFYL
jgi:hypothetical protein